MAQIATVSVPAPVVQLNNEQFIKGETVTPVVMQVPCREDFIDDVFEYWAVPIKDSGIFTRLQFIPIITNDGVAVSAPTFDSFHVFRVRDKLSGYTWWIAGTSTNFLDSCAACCGASAVPMPTFTPLLVAPCQTLCENSAGTIIGTFGLPVLAAGQKYFPKGALNNAALTAASAGGYTTVANLLTFLNASWTGFVWTATADGLTLLATGGAALDELCVTVVAIT